MKFLLINQRVNIMTTANNAATVETTEDMIIVPVRESVAVEIHALLETIGDSYIKVGTLLTEAREDFDDQKSFLSWAEAEFSIKKAQAYNLMNVARVFGEDKRFTGVSMRVMLALIPMADDAEVMEKAASLADVGTLTTAAVNELLGKPVKPAKPANDVYSQVVESEAFDKVEEAKREVALSPAIAANYTPQDVPEVEATPNPAASINDATTAALLEQNKRLSAQLEEAMTRIAALTSTRETKKASAPMLPQFKSQCLYARLGLSAEQATSKSAIQKARRELVKIGYGEGHDAWVYISEAVDKLTADAASTVSEE